MPCPYNRMTSMHAVANIVVYISEIARISNSICMTIEFC